jgi:hypothetical protein
MKVGTAIAKRDLTVRYLKDMIIVDLGDGARPLRELNLWLRTLSRDDALISTACTELLTEDKIFLDTERVMHLSAECIDA